MAILAKAQGNDNIEYADYSDAEQLRMRASPNKVDAVLKHLVNQQKISANVAFAVVGPIAFKRVV